MGKIKGYKFLGDINLYLGGFKGCSRFACLYITITNGIQNQQRCQISAAGNTTSFSGNKKLSGNTDAYEQNYTNYFSADNK